MQGKKNHLFFIFEAKNEMFVYILHHKPKSMTDVKTITKFFGPKYEEKLNFPTRSDHRELYSP